MKINKESWHYKLLLKYKGSESLMPKNCCQYWALAFLLASLGAIWSMTTASAVEGMKVYRDHPSSHFLNLGDVAEVKKVLAIEGNINELTIFERLKLLKNG